MGESPGARAISILERAHRRLDRLPERTKIAGLLALIAIGVALVASGLVGFDDDGARVNRAVERQYLERAGLSGSVDADCTWVKEVETTPEWWVCDISGPPPFGADVCNVDVTRNGGIKAKITYCLGEDFD